MAGELPVKLVGELGGAQEEQGMPCHFVCRAFAQYGEFHFQLGDADAALDGIADGWGILGVAVLVPVGGQLVMLGYPAVTLAEEADEERREFAAAVDFLEADFHGRAVFGFFFRDSPAQVDFAEAYLPLQTRCPDFGENLLDQVGPLRVHVAESGGEEGADFAVLFAVLVILLRHSVSQKK